MSKITTSNATSSILLDAEAVTKLTTIARASWYRLIAKGLFPRPVRIPGLRSQRWRAEEVHAWLHNIIEQAHLAATKKAKLAGDRRTEKPAGVKSKPSKAGM